MQFRSIRVGARLRPETYSGYVMFIGHYGPAFGAKAVVRRMPLWVLFVAVQFMDFVWSILVLVHVEKARIVPGFMEGSSLDLYYMPYTHGLAGALALSVVFGGVVALFFREGRRDIFLVTAAAVFSHWILDLLVHKPDLWIYDGVKVGFGLWRWLWISLPLELGFLYAGAWLYARYVPARRGGNAWLLLFVAAMTAVELYAVFGPPPTSPQAEAQTALMAYSALAAIAALVDLTRAKAARRDRPAMCVQASYLNDSETRARKATTLPSSIFMSSFSISATRKSRSELAAVSTALRAASSHDFVLVPMISVTR